MKKHRSFIAGFVIGAMVFGTTGAYAAGIMASKSNQPVYVNGVQADVEAYQIGGHNYFKLRDLGKAMGAAVSYDAKTNQVRIETAQRNQSSPQTEGKQNQTEQPNKQADTTDQNISQNTLISVSVEYGSDGRPLAYTPKAGSFLYGTGNVTTLQNPNAAPEYDGYMELKPFSKGSAYPAMPLRTINPAWDQSYYAITMPNPVPCYTHILAGEAGSFMGIALPEAKESTTMYVFNARETQRIIDTLYETFLTHPECYTNGVLNCEVQVGLTETGFEGNYFYPYRDSCVTQTVGGRNISYLVYALDIYVDGVYNETRYICEQNASLTRSDLLSTDRAIIKDRQNR